MSEEKKEAAAVESVSNQKKKKISKMNLQDIDTQLKNVESKMGGTDSQYARQLLKRKSIISA